MRKVLIPALCLGVFIALESGCHHKTPMPINTGFATTPTTATPSSSTDNSAMESQDVAIPGSELSPVDLASIMFNKDNGLIKPVYFEYDSFELSPESLETLRKNAEVLNQNRSLYVQVEGHCDERGTEEYNMALGDKRAQATREQLIRLGVSGDRIITITYGEEDPADPGHNEAAWAKNRRCEFAQGQKTN